MIHPDSTLRVLTTCPRDCYDGCGMEIELLGGVIRRVGGNKAHPISRGKLCEKCTLAYNSTWLDRAARLTRPQVRNSSKGAGQFEPVSWKTALGLVAQRIKDAIRTYGAQSVVHAHYTGTCGDLAGKYPLRFFQALGATEVDPDTVCNKAGHVALDYMFGRSTEGFDPRTAAEATSIFVWGVNPAHSAPRTFETWLKTSGARIVNNLAIGGVFSLFLRPARGSWVVTGNRVVDGKYVYSPFETENNCGTVTAWSDNDVVKVDPSYNVVATVRNDVACGAT